MMILAALKCLKGAHNGWKVEICKDYLVKF